MAKGAPQCQLIINAREMAKLNQILKALSNRGKLLRLIQLYLIPGVERHIVKITLAEQIMRFSNIFGGMLRLSLLLFLSLNSILLLAQYQYSGTILDSLTSEPLAFVNVVDPINLRGTTTDIDGKFQLTSQTPIEALRFSYIGYKNKSVNGANLQKGTTIYLQADNVQLSEVEILPGVNPAHRIIDLAVENKDRNNPEKSTEFYYESYNKLVITGELDSTILANQDSLQLLDTNQQEVYEFLSSQHLFMMESITERNHIPPELSKEVVRASRISGLKNPIFSLIGTQMQSFSFYTNYISLFGNNYLSPISKGSTSKYLFMLSDTILVGSDSIFVIKFQPKKGKNFEGMKGLLHINTNGFAVQNVIAEPVEQEDMEIKIQQRYAFIDDKQWFPTQLNTNLVFKNVDLGGYPAVGIGRSYIKNISLESKLNKREIGNTILSLDPKAGKQSEDYWNDYRSDSLDVKEQKTYTWLDSIGEAENFDEKILIVRTIATGAIPWGPIDMPINRFFDFNDYEGIRLGLGAETNDKVIRNFRLGGYGAYGFQDEAFKYGGYAKWTPESNRGFNVRASYSNDVTESGGTTFSNDRLPTFSNEGLKKFYISRMDGVEKYQMDVGFRALRDFQFTFIGNLQNRTITSDYRFFDENLAEGVEPTDQFTLFETALDIRYSFREKYAEMFGMKFPVESKYPVVHLRLSQGLDDYLDADYDYQRVDVKIDQHILWKGLGTTSLRIAGGLIEGEIPITAQFRMQGTFSSGFLLATEYSFETMRPNEFYADRYASFFFRHDFKDLLLSEKKFNPGLVLIFSYGVGQLTQTDVEQHRDFSFTTMENGLAEGGLAINNLLKLGMTSIGVAGFYRMGSYASEDWEDNAVFKLSTSVAF